MSKKNFQSESIQSRRKTKQKQNDCIYSNFSAADDDGAAGGIECAELHRATGCHGFDDSIGVRREKRRCANKHRGKNRPNVVVSLTLEKKLLSFER